MPRLKPWRYLHAASGERIKVDREDFERINRHSWTIIQQRNEGKRQAVTSIKTKTGYKQVTLGKFIMNPPKGKFVYPRRSREELDYRKSNLIVCTMKERQIMLPKRRGDTSSRFKGVSWDRSKSRWRAHIDIKGQTRAIGYFKDEEEAALAYNKRAKELYGDIAYQNPVRARKVKRQD